MFLTAALKSGGNVMSQNRHPRRSVRTDNGRRDMKPSAEWHRLRGCAHRHLLRAGAEHAFYVTKLHKLAVA
jgi:hypothetical protein